VVEANAQYRHPARYDDEIVVETTLKELGPSKIIFQYQVTRKREGQLLATGHTKHVWVSKEMKRVHLHEFCPKLYDKLTKMVQP
jgi:acyl-CoA thioester hydrolase